MPWWKIALIVLIIAFILAPKDTGYAIANIIQGLIQGWHQVPHK